MESSRGSEAALLHPDRLALTFLSSRRSFLEARGDQLVIHDHLAVRNAAGLVDGLLKPLEVLLRLRQLVGLLKTGS